MKRIVRRVANAMGFEITRLANVKKTVRSNELSYHQTVTGNYYLPADANQDKIAQAIRNNQIFDVEVYEIAKEFIRPGTTALDVGSNFGQMAVLMSKLVGEKGTVHAFDADDFVFTILQKNIKENASNIQAHFGAVHDTAGETLYFPVQDFERFSTYGSYGIDYVSGKGRPVKTITIDEIGFEHPVSFMKVDVQGGDLFAMKGAVKTIAKYRMPILFEYEYVFEKELNLNFQDYVDFVRSINYIFARVINGQNYLIVPAP